LLTVILILPCSGATGSCNGVSYNKDIYRCEYGELIGKCKGKDYYVAYDKCVNGVVVSGIATSNNSGTYTGNRGTFTDSRDGKTYKWVKIGSQTWMAENLNYNAKNGSQCYYTPADCDKFGRLYNWATAKVACPKNWHLPTIAEWEVLVATVGDESTAGKYLKATSGWNCYGYSYNGTDSYGFRAIPSGAHLSVGNSINVGDGGDWWSSSTFESDTNFAYYLFMLCVSNETTSHVNPKTGLLSVRCVQD